MDRHRNPRRSGFVGSLMRVAGALGGCWAVTTTGSANAARLTADHVERGTWNMKWSSAAWDGWTELAADGICSSRAARGRPHFSYGGEPPDVRRHHPVEFLDADGARSQGGW